MPRQSIIDSIMFVPRRGIEPRNSGSYPVWRTLPVSWVADSGIWLIRFSVLAIELSIDF
jgi:hypothetical protein